MSRSNVRHGAMGPRTAMALELSNRGVSRKAVALAMGVHISTVYSLLHLAERHTDGSVKHNERPAMEHVPVKFMESIKRCPACGLRGAHECLRGATFVHRDGTIA